MKNMLFRFAAGLSMAATALALSPIGAVATGNGAPSGAHYNLNIIGMSKDKTADMTSNSGHRIFVDLNGKTKINLTEGDFQVLDANGTDGTAAFQLPVADTDVNNCETTDTGELCGSGVTTYSVFIRALGGKGQGSATMVLCGVDDFGEEVCSNSELTVSDGGSRPSKFTNVTGYLLYLYDVDIDTDGDGIGDVHYRRIPLFSDVLQDYFWNYDNNGLRIAQLRFYPCSSTVGDDSPDIVVTACE